MEEKGCTEVGRLYVSGQHLFRSKYLSEGTFWIRSHVRLNVHSWRHFSSFTIFHVTASKHHATEVN